VSARVLDIVERSVWTLVQTASAGALVVGWNKLDLGPDVSLAYVPVVAFLLSAVKSELATKFGNGTAATLPAAVEAYQPRRAL
jgi:hypothetical protein